MMKCVALISEHRFGLGKSTQVSLAENNYVQHQIFAAAATAL